MRQGVPRLVGRAIFRIDHDDGQRKLVYFATLARGECLEPRVVQNFNQRSNPLIDLAIRYFTHGSISDPQQLDSTYRAPIVTGDGDPISRGVPTIPHPIRSYGSERFTARFPDNIIQPIRQRFSFLSRHRSIIQRILL